MASDFHELWWKDSHFEDSRKVFSTEANTLEAPLKIEAAKRTSDWSPPSTTGPHAIEIDLLKNAQIDGIITTNWDQFLSSLFPDFTSYIGQDAVLFEPLQGVAEIFKIHGCVTKPSSLVLTNEDYQEFARKNPYLVAKLLTLFVEHPVIFLGYKIGDQNVQAILKQLVACLDSAGLQRLSDHLIFVERASGDSESFDRSHFLIDSVQLPVTLIRTDDFTKVFGPLSKLKRQFRAAVLRHLKEQVYNLVLNAPPKGTISVVPFNDTVTLEKVEIVVGVGIAEQIGTIGYSGITVNQLLEDVVRPENGWVAKKVVTDVLPRYCNKSRKYVPFYKYLSDAGFINSKGTLDVSKLDPKLADRISEQSRNDFSLSKSSSYRKNLAAVRATCSSVSDVVKKYGTTKAIIYIPFLADEQIDLDQLHQFLNDNLHFLNTNVKAKNAVISSFYQTYFKQLICLYDWLKYRHQKTTIASFPAAPTSVAHPKPLV